MAFKVLEEHAISGARCPPREGKNSIPSYLTRGLAQAGRIYIEVSGRNYRQVTILVGEHKGKKTAPNPDPTASVWLTSGKEGTKINGRFASRGPAKRPQPSAPRPLTAAELK